MSEQHVIPADWAVPTEFPPPAEVRVRFGQLDNQTMPLAWAEQFLAIVYAEHPGTFRAILPRLYGLPAETKKPRAPRKPKDSQP